MIQNDFVPTSRAKDAIIGFLQEVFAAEDLFRKTTNIYKFSHDEKSSRMMISDYNTQNLNSVNIKPALLVQRGTMIPQRLSIGDRTTISFFNPREVREFLFNVGFTINCYSRQGLEAEFLAVTVFKLIRYLNEDIQKRSEIFDIEANGIGSEIIIQRDSRDELINVPVSVRIQIPDAVEINFNKIQHSRLQANIGTISVLEETTSLETIGVTNSEIFFLTSSIS